MTPTSQTSPRRANRRKSAREHEGAERLQLALSAGQLGDWTWDTASDRVTLGARAAECFGLPDAAPITWADMRRLLHPDDRDRAREAVEAALRDHTDYDIEYRVARPGGVEAWIAAKGRGVYAGDGSALGMIGVVHDVTDRKKLELVQHRLAAVVESSDDAIISKDLNGIVQTWNSGAERIFGYSAAEMVGTPVRRLIPHDLQGEEDDILDRQRRGERIDHYETVRIRKDGRKIDVSLTVSPIRDASGRVMGASKVARDITARKRAEADLFDESRLLNLLNETGKSIAADLDLEALVQTVTDATTQLSGAEFGALFLNVKDETGPTFHGASPIRIHDVLEDDRYENWSPPFGVPEGHLPVAWPAQPSHRSGTWPTPKSSTCTSTWTRVPAPSGAIPIASSSVHVKLTREGDQTTFTVVDNGQGIKPEFLPHLFERFRQADSSSTRFHGGLGLGLSIVKSLVELHGGSVRATSEGPGKGATFCIELPTILMSAVPAESRHASALTAEQPGGEHGSLQGLTVLVVEDEPDALDLLKRILGDSGALVFTAGSARIGLELLKRERPDVLISDIGMPDEDGYMLIRHVRALKSKQGGKTPAAAVSAFARPEDRTRALRAGFQMHLAKPVDPTELTAVVASLATRKSKSSRSRSEPQS